MLLGLSLDQHLCTLIFVAFDHIHATHQPGIAPVVKELVSHSGVGITS